MCYFRPSSFRSKSAPCCAGPPPQSTLKQPRLECPSGESPGSLSCHSQQLSLKRLNMLEHLERAFGLFGCLEFPRPNAQTCLVIRRPETSLATLRFLVRGLPPPQRRESRDSVLDWKVHGLRVVRCSLQIGFLCIAQQPRL